MKRILPNLFIHVLALALVGLGLMYTVQHFEFAEPWLLWLLCSGIVHVFYRIYLQSNAGFVGLIWSWESPDSQLTWRTMAFQAIPEIPYALRTLSLSFLAIAAAQPQSSSSIEDLTREGIDIVLSMDVSASMLSKDFSPNRLESSKAVATKFVDERPNDRIGVVAYEGEAFTQIPLTTDQRIVMNGIQELETGLLEGGTAIGMGLATAVNRLKNSDAQSKVIILLTDGVNNAGKIDPMDAAQLAALNDIRVYTIGVGTIGKARSPVAKVGNRYQYDWVEVEIDEKILRQISNATGGKYFRATNEAKLQSIYMEIDELEKTKFNVLRYNQKTEEFLPFALIAAFAFLLEFLLRHLMIPTIL